MYHNNVVDGFLTGMSEEKRQTATVKFIPLTVPLQDPGNYILALLSRIWSLRLRVELHGESATASPLPNVQHPCFEPHVKLNLTAFHESQWLT